MASWFCSNGQSTDAVLTTEANVIKNETNKGANTALRVGQMFLDLINSKVSILSPQLGTSSTSGYVWTATDALGNGSWQAATGNTYSAGTGLTLITNTFSVNSSQNISTLSNLTSNGLIKTSGGTGTLSIAISGTDYAPATSGTAIFYGNGSGGFSNVTVGSGLTFSGGTLSNSGSGLTVGTTAISSGATTKVLYDNAGALGEYSISGSGNVAMTASPTFTGTPTLPSGTIITTQTVGNNSTTPASTAYVDSNFRNQSVTISSNTFTLDFASYYQSIFYNTTAVTANFTVALSNTTNALSFEFKFKINGTGLTMTCPSDFTMQSGDANWSGTGTHIYTFNGVLSNVYYNMTGTYNVGRSKWEVVVSASDFN